MRVTLVRHAQSRNNAVSAGHAEAAAGGGRVPDPELTEAGRKQAESLGKAAADGRGMGTVREVWVSPMKRALQTAAPLAKETGAKVVVRGDCFEQGGVHEHGGRAPRGSAEPRAMGLDEAGIKEVLTAAGVDAANIEVHANVFQGADKTQGWYRAAYESMDDALGRAKRFADALWKEAELHHDDAAYCDAQAGGPCLVVVAHGLFLDMLARELLGLADVEAPVPSPRRLLFPSANTGRSSFDLSLNGFARGGEALQHRTAALSCWNALDHLPPVDGNALTAAMRETQVVRTGGSARAYQASYRLMDDQD